MADGTMAVNTEYTPKLDATGLQVLWALIDEGYFAKGNAGVLAGLDEVQMAQLASEVTELINSKAASATTLEGYGITDAYKKSETYTQAETDGKITAAVSQAIAGVYAVKGSSTFASLPTEGVQAGWVYNILDEFTTTDAFVEGAGNVHAAGTNVVWTGEKWDCMAGVWDMSIYAKTADLRSMTEEEIRAICTMPV